MIATKATNGSIVANTAANRLESWVKAAIIVFPEVKN
jgi:hypothetical protein